MRTTLSVLASIFILAGCTNAKKKEQSSNNEEIMKDALKDIHSASNYQLVQSMHITLDLTADFETKKLKGFVTHTIKNNGADQIIFDTKDLTIEKIVLDDKGETKYEFVKEDEILGQSLAVDIKKETKSVTIYYETSPESEAVQWLNPQQTAYKKFPFLFTQGEAILTRSWIPLQDSPGNKITYSATIRTPEELTAVMSAKKIDMATEELGVHYFTMEQPIPSYLIALAIGKLEYQSLGDRSGVYAEPNMIDACVYEFQDIERMISVAEDLYGEYLWEQYDVIVLPPSFPFGGMENPRLTFATPTIIAGDRSLTSLIAHELAHSWSGNLTTNATWNDFWLNEGFTVYIERRITEELYGRDYSEMLALLGHQDLEHSIDELPADETSLKLSLKGRSPDDGMTDIAYEKGYFFLRMLEENVGRERFDDFLKQYFKDFKFKNLTTEEFIVYLEKELPEAKELNVKEWIYEPGIPDNSPKVVATNFEKVEKALTYSPSTFGNEEGLNPEKWTTHEWLHYIRNIDVEEWKNEGYFKEADAAFHFTTSKNSEIAAAWYEKSIEAGYKEVYPEVEKFLIRVGRRKFLTPLYKALLEADEKEFALKIYEQARPNYHFVSTNTMDNLLGYQNS